MGIGVFQAVKTYFPIYCHYKNLRKDGEITEFSPKIFSDMETPKRRYSLPPLGISVSNGLNLSGA